MSDLRDLLPEFERNRQMVRRDLFEKQAVMFERWADAQREAELARVNKILGEANDFSPGALSPTDTTCSANPDLSEMQKQLEHTILTADLTPSLDKRIREAGQAP